MKTSMAGPNAMSHIRVFLIATCIIAVTPHLSAVNAHKRSPPRELSVADRVKHQHAIEEVYWQHRIWPKENRRPKPSLDEVMSTTLMQQKVEKGLRDSELLARKSRSITPEQLQAEMDRMAWSTKQPDLLHELFAALNNDPALVAECLVKPFLSERLLRDLPTEGESHHDEEKEQTELKAGTDSRTQRIVLSRNYTLPQIAPTATTCDNDSWVATATTNAPNARDLPAAVWTGSEMILWSGGHNRTGGRYNPSTDSWTATSTINAPQERAVFTAVWTGTEMIVWGGISNHVDVNTGGRYNPATDSWAPTTTTNAPIARDSHTAVWTGSEMIVWGGYDDNNHSGNHGNLNTGGRYDPTTDSWRATATDCAPFGRWVHTAVWTGVEMIVWGGISYLGYDKTGGRYNPETDSWTETTTNGAPGVRTSQTAVWTGVEMIVWGGHDYETALANGGRYNPSTDSWVATTTTGAPEARTYHTAIWTGNEMIVWGGSGVRDLLNSGGRYNPYMDKWVETQTVNAPDARWFYAAIWTGSEMIVWGGDNFNGNGNGQLFQTGGKYCVQPPTTPIPGPVTPTPTPNPPTQLVNLSTRLPVRSGDGVGIGGFIITGTDPKQLLLRGIGPSLGGVLTGVLADPELELHGQGAFPPVTNNNWKDSQEAEIQATGIAPSNDLESAILVTLNPGLYTVILRGHDTGSGVALVDVYDLSLASASKLTNISTRAYSYLGDDVIIAGLTLGNNSGSDTVVIRGIGPSLTASGIIDVLDDPIVQVRDSDGAPVAVNDDWTDCSLQAQQLIALGRAPIDPRESAIVARLAPGAYTAILFGPRSGIGLIEVYGQSSPVH